MAYLKSLTFSTTVSLASWDRCFLCSSKLPPVSIPEESSEQTRSRSSLVSRDFTILFKYLLQSCSDTLLQNSLLNCPAPQLARAGVKLCSSCSKVAESLKEQHMLLEVVQLKIIDSLKTLKSKIISNSRLFGTNEEVLETFQEFESSLDEQEKQGINCDEEKKLLELILTLQTFIFESGNNTQIPLVFLEKFVGTGTNKARGGGAGSSGRLGLALKRDPKAVPKYQDSKVKHEPDNARRSPTKEENLPPTIKEFEQYKDSIDFENCVEPLGNECLPNDTNDLNDPAFRMSAASESEYEISKDFDWKHETLRKKPRLAPCQISRVADAKPKARRGRPPKPKIPGVPAKKYSAKKPVMRKTKTTYSCEICDFCTRKLPAFEVHFHQHETDEKHHPCPDCDLSFTTKQYFELHQSLRHGERRRIKCDLCGEMISKKEFENHILKDHGKDQVFSCDLCYHSYGAYPALIRHFDKHNKSVSTGIRKLKCRLCPSESAPEFSIANLLFHLAKSHEGYSNLLSKCEYPNCGKSFVDKDTARGHQFVHERRFACEQCGNCYPSKFTLDRHIKFVHEGVKMKFKCDVCGENFYQKWEVENHQRKEHGIGYECPLCVVDGDEKTRYASRSKLYTHRKKAHPETFEKREREVLHCPDCDRTFDLPCHLADHRNVHKKIKDFTCEICGFATKTMELLKNHKECHEDKTKYKCEHCPKTFGSRNRLRLHKFIHLEVKPYQCDLCGMSFRQNSTFYKHKRRHLTNPNFGKSSQEGRVEVEEKQATNLPEAGV